MARSTNLNISLLDEGLLNVLRNGGCQCDPPGSGEQFCTGHCHLRAEVERLRAEVAERLEMWRVASETAQQYAAEIERLKREVDYWMNLDAAALERENERLRKIERAARAAVQTEKALGYVRLTLLADVLDEA